MGFLLKVRDSSKLGAYPLRGVIMNTWDMKPADVLKNKELGELVAILGLDINDPNSVDNMTYAGVATLTDADHDGEKIAVLLIGFFYKFWPRLITEKRIHITRSPIMISTNGKDVKWFYGYDSAQKFKNSADSKGYSHRYIKGLGSLQESEYDRVINSPVLDTITMDSPELMDMMLGPDSTPRKEFMLK
jgi:DNA gyrase/topoisomerase IV subunit B